MAWRSTAPTAPFSLQAHPGDVQPRVPAGVWQQQQPRCGVAGPGAVAGGGHRCSRLTGLLPLLLAGSGLEYLLLALTGPLFLGALAIYHKRKRLRHGVPADGLLPAVQVATPTAMPLYQQNSLCWPQPHSCQVLENATSTVQQSSKHLLQHPLGSVAESPAPPEPHGALLQGSQLYAIINAVPVRRWKEFMRVLELREAEIELVELEVAHIRDQQYEMLKRWCQQTSATLDRVFTALEHMELAGCAEELRRSLMASP